MLWVVFGIAACFPLIREVLKYQATQISPYLFLTPVLGLTIAVLAFGETRDPLDILGVTLILTGVAGPMLSVYKTQLRTNSDSSLERSEKERPQ
jgi:drug/metabolite transporter (DMT)-like permease